MGKKLLVITAGTVAASVGRTLLRQMKAHLSSELLVNVRYIDTAYLPDRDTTLRDGEWFQLSIDDRYMKALYNKREQHPQLERMLFPGLLPGTASTGGGSIRYNGAGAVEVKREDLRAWLSGCMINLARDGDGSTNVSVALIVSAVGATGSGSLEHLIDVIVDAAHFAGIETTDGAIRCDTYILQPSQDVTDLGLANTMALYAELAASQLAGGGTRVYQGRKVLIGWGSSRALGSIEQLQEVAATIVRLGSDPSSSFAAEFREREVDNHILRELDPISNLPMHLSLATVVTVSMGRLEEQVIQRDVTRLVNSLVFDTTSVSSGSDNVLLGKFADALAGEDAESRYRKLLDYLAEAVHLADKYQLVDKTLNARGTADSDKGPKLMSIWQEAKGDVNQSRHRIQDFARTFTANAQVELDRIKGERICKGGVSLTELREEYRSLQNVLEAILKVAREDTRTTVNDGLVTRQQKALGGMWPVSAMNRKTKLRQLASAIKRNLQEHLQENTRSSAIGVLEKLEQRCAEIGRNLDIVLNKLRRKRDDDIRFAATSSKFAVDSGNPMNIVALSQADDINTYAAQVSVFTSDENAPDQLAEFRQWLQGRPELEALFKGNLDQVMGVITRYTQDKVREAMKKHSVLDILHRTGEDSLSNRLIEASRNATALVKFSKDFSPGYREAWHVSAFYGNGDQQEELQEAIKEAFPQGQCKLLKSKDPAEIAVFYYVDGIPMSAVNDLKGRCLNAFLKRRVQWLQHKEVLNASRPVDSIGYLNQRVGVPIFSGKDAEERVQSTGVLKRLFEAKGEEVGDYKLDDLPELQVQQEVDPHKSNGKGPGAGGQNGTGATIHKDVEPAEGNASDDNA